MCEKCVKKGAKMKVVLPTVVGQFLKEFAESLRVEIGKLQNFNVPHVGRLFAGGSEAQYARVYFGEKDGEIGGRDVSDDGAGRFAHLVDQIASRT